MYLSVAACGAALSSLMVYGLVIERSQVQCSAGVVVSLSKELYSHCSSPPSCVTGDPGKQTQTGRVSLMWLWSRWDYRYPPSGVLTSTDSKHLCVA